MASLPHVGDPEFAGGSQAIRQIWGPDPRVKPEQPKLPEGGYYLQNALMSALP
jgi:hypothetical protein